MTTSTAKEVPQSALLAMSAGRWLWALGITARDVVLEPAAQEFADATAGLTPTLFEHVNPLGTYTFNTDRPRRPAPTARVQARARQALAPDEGKASDVSGEASCARFERGKRALARGMAGPRAALPPLPRLDQSWSPAVAGIIGARRACTLAMISSVSMPWR
jgi:hypothetical protein